MNLPAFLSIKLLTSPLFSGLYGVNNRDIAILAGLWSINHEAQPIKNVFSFFGLWYCNTASEANNQILFVYVAIIINRSADFIRKIIPTLYLEIYQYFQGLQILHFHFTDTIKISHFLWLHDFLVRF
jgi:hypothetical protein